MKAHHGYWTAAVVSALWFLIATIASGHLVLAIADGGVRIHQRSDAEWIIGGLLIIQPLLIAWAMVRAHRMRRQGGARRIIGRAFLPFATLLPVALAIAFNIHDRNVIAQRLNTQRSSGTIAFDCRAHSATVDFDRRTAGAVDLRLIASRREGQRRKWQVQWPGHAPARAEPFEASTGSIGGSQGLTWSDATGKPFAALLSFSDIIGSYGPESIWVVIIAEQAADMQEKLDRDDVGRFTCGPDPASYRP